MSTNEPGDESKDISSLQESFNKQQKKISALKEMVRKSEVAHGKSTSTAQEKVRNIAQRLTHLKFKARSRQSNEITPTSPTIQADTVDLLQTPTKMDIAPRDSSTSQNKLIDPIEETTAYTSGSDKVQLLRQQMEQNKLRMAQRASSKQHLEQMVSQLKEKFDSTQQYLEDTTELGKSMSDLSGFVQTPVSRERFKSATDLSTQSFSLEKERIKFLENRCRLLEKQLEKEKQLHLNQQMDNSLSESLNALKERNTELEEKILILETTLKEANESAKKDNIELEKKLESAYESSERLSEELSTKEKRINELQEALDVSDSLLEESAQRLKAMEKEVEESEIVPVEATTTLLENEEVKAEMAKQIQQLSDELRMMKAKNEELNESLEESEKLEVSDVNIAEKLTAYETQIETLRLELDKERERYARKEEEVMEKTIELNVLNANFKVLEEKLEINNQNKQLFPQTADETETTAFSAEIQQLKQKLDESNKAMIKLKLKCKQTEKQMEKLKKSSNLHEEVANLQAKNEQLQHKITELEDEKGQWQLNVIDSKETLATNDAELEEKCKKQTETIRLLEEEKFEHIQQLEELRKELGQLQQQVDTNKETDRVKSEMSEIQWEEQISEQEVRIKELLETVRKRDEEVHDLQEKLKETQCAKEDLEKKVRHYLTENMELLDKIEKLSKSSSSAESIEIVERLTQQEHAELAAYDKNLSNESQETSAVKAVNELTQTELAPDLSESLIKLREESSELMNKIELFTNERREVLDKMEALTAENSELVQKIAELNEQRDELESNALLAENTKTQLEAKLTNLNQEKQMLISEIEQSKKLGNKAGKELSSLQQTSEIVAALDPKEDATLFDKCEKSLAKLNAELEAYRRAADKGAKFNACKKLAKEAKNAHVQLSELLQKVKEASSAVETVTVVETVVAVTASDGSALVEYEQLNAQNRDLKKRLQELELQLEDVREDAAFAKDTEMKEQIIANKEKMAEYEKKCEKLHLEVENLQLALLEARVQAEQRSSEVENLQSELTQLRNLSDDFERQINDKDIAFENKVEQLMRLRNQLQDKCETYEAEMEVLQTLVKEQKQQLIEAYKENEHELNLKLLELQQRDETIKQLKADLKELRERNEATTTDTAKQLSAECDKLKEALRINKNLVAEQIEELSNKQDTIDTLNTQITELYKTMEKNVNEVIEKEDEIARLQKLLDENKQQLETLRKDKTEQQIVVDKLLNELHSHRNNLPQLEADVARLEVEKVVLEKQNKEQVEKMKKFVANLKKRTQQCQEYECKIKELEKGALEQLQTKEQQQDLEEIETLKQALQNKTMEHLEALEKLALVQLELQNSQQDLEQYRRETVQLQNAFAAAQMCDDQTMQLEQQKLEILELRTKLQEMKQIEDELDLQQSENDQLRMEIMLLREAERRERQAAEELRERVAVRDQDIQELKAELQKRNSNVNETQTQKVLTAEELENLQQELKNKTIKFEKSKAVIKEYKNQIQRLQVQIQELQQQLSKQPEEEEEDAKDQTKIDMEAYEEFKIAHATLQMKYTEEQKNFQKTIERLETLHSGIEAKLQEDMSYIETLEQENAKYKEKVHRLQEAVSAYEERRASMERQVSLLDAQMQTRADEYERHEDELVYRLNMLSEHDEIIAQRLLKTHEQKESVQEQLQQMQEENAKLNKQLNQLEKDYKTLESNITVNLEEAQEKLRLQLAEKHDEELQRVTKSNEAKIKELQAELEEQDNELSEQLLRLQTERRALNEQLERSRDEVVRLQEALHALEQHKAELERLQQESSQQDQLELQELRMQSMQDKTELENLRQQIDTLINNHNLELQGLRAQISDLDNLGMQVGQNQTDDQVFIETENKRLTELLIEKQALIEQLQQQCNANVNANLRDRNADLQRQLLELQNRQQTATTPAAANFFANNEVMSSPFDEIVQTREVTQLAALPQQTMDTRAQSTIEDLQRNVSDLEKHAHELELKLANYKEQERSLQEALQQIQNLQQEKAQLEEKLQQQTIESQIISAPPTLDMFFGASAPATEFEQLVQHTKADNVDQATPVVEEVIVPKKAYICQPSHEEMALDLGGDDWGDVWSGNEELAATTARSTSLLSQEQELNLQLQESQENFMEMQKKYAESEAQREELQVKCNKLLKKLKEYKQKLESNASTNDFDNLLDVAIQDELKAQIEKLEARLAEQQKLQETALAEKEKLLQRIDVLEAGNERMSEMKERQDTDVYMYQARIRELQQKLQAVETASTEQGQTLAATTVATAQETVTAAQAEKVQQELQDAYAEQQELQALLEEERANVQHVEAKLKNLQQTNENTNIELNAAKTEFNAFKLQHQLLQQQFNEISDENTKLQAMQAQLQQQVQQLQNRQQTDSQQQQQMQETQAQLKQQQEENEHLKEENSTLQQQLNEIKSQMEANEEQLAELQSQLMAEREKNVELMQANKELSANVEEVEKLQKQLSARLTETSTTPNDELLMKLAEKDSEIMHLKQQTENLMREDQTEKLVLEILSKNQEIHMLKLKIKDLEDDKQELQHNLSLQITQEMQASKENTAKEAEERLKAYEEKVKDLEQEKSSMEEELRVLNDHVMQSLQLEEKLKATLLELDVKNAEITQLRNSLANKNTTTTNDANWESIIEQRCAEIAQMWRLHLEQREEEFKAVELQLQTQIESLRNAANQQQQQQQVRPPPNQRGISTETTGTSTPASETSSAPASETSSATASKDNSPLHRHALRASNDDSQDIVEKMQAALESQEMEIMTLKEQLAIRSAEYARLAAQYDPFNSSNSPTGARASNDANNDTVAKSELDLALYMLHQRDVRCEEMTLELVRLLEERDTLQLKLSNTLRQVETMKLQTQTGSDAVDLTNTASNLSFQMNVEQQQAATQEQSNELNQKLSELSTVNHSKDKVIKDEREERNRQMEKIQHDVAKIPPAAVSDFPGSDLSQGSESSSSVLLNWLWGNKPASTTGNAPNN